MYVKCESIFLYNDKGKGNIIPLHATKAHRDRRGTVSHFYALRLLGLSAQRAAKQHGVEEKQTTKPLIWSL